MRTQTCSNGGKVPVVLLGPGHGYTRSWPNFRREQQRESSRDMLLAVAMEIADGHLPEAAIDHYGQPTARKVRHLVMAIRIT